MNKEEFKKAFDLVQGIHDQNGDSHWRNYRERLMDDVSKYKTFETWQSRLNGRSDISDDERWDLECFDASIEVLFNLCVKDLK